MAVAEGGICEMSKVDVEALRRKLNESVEVVEETFADFHLQVRGYGFCGISEDSGWMQLLMEIASESGEKLEGNVEIKVNFYDKEGVIIYYCDSYVCDEFFSGYDTIHKCLNEDNLAFNVARCKIFATKGC